MPSSSTHTLTHNSAIAEHDLIVPREIDADISATIAAALNHSVDSNRHRATMLRSATDPAMAASLYLGLTMHAEATIEDGWPAELSRWMSEKHNLDCWVHRYVVRGLIEPGDSLAVHTVQTRLARLLMDFPAPATEDELTLLHHDPVALVRAAYAIVRELAA